VDSWRLYFALGLVVVLWLASRRFDTPTPVRSFTTAVRYYWGVLAYMAAGALLYCALDGLVLFALGSAGGYPHQSVPLAALALTVVVVRLPFISHADRWLRNVLHRAAGYPAEAHRLAALLSSAPLSPTDAVRSEVRSLLIRRGYDPADDWLPVAQPMRELWDRTAMLFQQVRTWDRHQRYGDFVSAAREEFDVLRQRFDQLSMKVVRVLGTIERLGGLWEQVESATLPTPHGRRSTDCDQVRSQCGDTVRVVVNELLADLREDIAFFQRNLCVLVARGVLAEGTTVRQRQRRLEELGFTVQLQGPSTATLLAWAAGLYFAVFVAFLALPPLLHDASFAHLIEQLMRVTRITGSQVIAVAVAIIPKQHFGFANEDLHGRTPWSFVLGAGLVAAALAAAIQIAFLGSSFSTSAPWLVMPFATAAIIAYLVQDSRWVRSGFADRQRLADAVVMLIGVGIALALARGLRYAFFGEVSSSNGGYRWWYDPAVVLLIGVGIGAFVPSACRRPPHPGAGRFRARPKAATLRRTHEPVSPTPQA
jgi:hypothetical protein